jgi:hypothetical protein
MSTCLTYKYYITKYEKYFFSFSMKSQSEIVLENECKHFKIHFRFLKDSDIIR